jgi:type II secretory pathway pseudopilin PulG
MNRLRLFFKKMRNEEGISLPEVIIATGLIGFVGYMTLNQLGSMNKSVHKIQVKSNSRALTRSLVSQIGNNLSHMQIDYSSDSDIEGVGDLPMAWDVDGKIAIKKNCPACKGEFGVVLKPLPDYKGLYMMVVKIRHQKFENDIFIKRLVSQ